MNENLVRGIVIGHGRMAEGLVDAARSITDAPPDALVAVSNRGLSPESLGKRVEKLLHGPTIVFVDLQTGSCGFAARRICRDRDDAAVLFGVNLPQLLDFVTHRELPLGELITRLLDRGRSGICCAPEFVKAQTSTEEHADRPVSRG